MYILYAGYFVYVHLSDVSLDLSDSGQRGHCLQIHSHNLHFFSRITFFFSTPEWKYKQ